MAEAALSKPKTRIKRYRGPIVGPDSAGRLMTAAEFDALAYDDCVPGFRYELINGVFVVCPAASSAERGPNDELGALLRAYRKTHPGGGRLDDTLPEQDVFLSANRRRADRAIWIGLGRRPDDERDIPTILIEFVSAGRRDAVRDYETKRDEYLIHGVKEYWVIDRFLRQMTVFRPGLEAVIILETQTYETPLLPGFVLPLGDLLGEADNCVKPSRGGRRRPAPPKGGENG